MVVATAHSTSNPESFEEVSTLLRRAAEDGVFPGAVVVVGQRDTLLFREACGVRSTQSDESNHVSTSMHSDMVFDIGELTQVVGTTTVMMKLLEAQLLRLDDRVSRYIQTFGVFGKSAITIDQLLSHRSGLASWMPFHEDLMRENAGARMGILTSRGAREFIYNQINRSELVYQPGTRQEYSEVGFIVLGHLIELVSSLSLERAVHRFVAQPLGLRSTSFIDISMMKRRGIAPVTDVIAPTEECSWRKRTLCGEVHDENAWAMGGIAGHCGLFSTARELGQFAAELLRVYRGESNFLSRQLLRYFWSYGVESPNQGWRFGWDTPGPENSMAGSGLSKQAVGICSATGCSLWMEPEQGVYIVLLSNHIHPNRNNRKIHTFRPQLHRAIMKAIAAL